VFALFQGREDVQHQYRTELISRFESELAANLLARNSRIEVITKYKWIFVLLSASIQLQVMM
jgi:hypothetical protein